MRIEDIKFETEILAIMPSEIENIINTRRNVGIKFNGNREEYQAAINRRATKFKNVKGKYVVLPLHGYISHKPSLWSLLGFETSSETLAGWIEDLTSNKDVGAIILDIDSPGGTVAGLTGVTNRIYESRGKKPIIALVNDLMASAAYFLGSAATEIVADPDSLTGSIGTIAVHLDWSKFLENEGVKATILHAGKYKKEGNPYEALSEEAREDWQKLINDYYETFVNIVARNRGLKAGDVKENFGQGRVLKAQKAKAVGMIDRIATFKQVLTDLQPKGKTKAKARSEIEYLKLNVL